MRRELISKLYQEAVNYSVNLGPNPDGTNRAWVWEEKFVDLIVKECVSVGCTAFLNDNSTAPIFPAKQICQHFGVKNDTN